MQRCQKLHLHSIIMDVTHTQMEPDTMEFQPVQKPDPTHLPVDSFVFLHSKRLRSVMLLLDRIYVCNYKGVEEALWVAISDQSFKLM